VSPWRHTTAVGSAAAARAGDPWARPVPRGLRGRGGDGGGSGRFLRLTCRRLLQRRVDLGAGQRPFAQGERRVAGAVEDRRGEPARSGTTVEVDRDRGAELFQACAACHTLTPDGGNRAGPTLHGVFGRRIATAPGYNFSTSLKALDIVWNAETIQKLFEIGPSRYTPGTKMPEQTIGDPADRAALVRFLEQASKSR